MARSLARSSERTAAPEAEAPSHSRPGFPFPVHVHMLRHGCGYALANAGHDTRRIQEASFDPTHFRYSELSAAPFQDFWRDRSSQRRHVRTIIAAMARCSGSWKQGGMMRRK